MIGKDVLPEKDLLEKAAAIKRLEYSLLGKELKKLISIAEKEYQKFVSAFESSKNKENKTKKKNSPTASNLFYNNYILLFTNITKLMNLLNVL